MHNKLGHLTVLCASAVAAVWRLAPGEARFETLDVQALRLIDASGAVLATLRSDEAGPKFELLDREGKARLRVEVDHSPDRGPMPSLFLLDEEGQPALHLYEMDGSHGDLKAIEFLREGKRYLTIGDSGLGGDAPSIVMAGLDSGVSVMLAGAGIARGPQFLMQHGDMRIEADAEGRSGPKIEVQRGTAPPATLKP